MKRYTLSLALILCFASNSFAEEQNNSALTRAQKVKLIGYSAGVLASVYSLIHMNIMHKDTTLAEWGVASNHAYFIYRMGKKALETYKNNPSLEEPQEIESWYTSPVPRYASLMGCAALGLLNTAALTILGSRGLEGKYIKDTVGNRYAEVIHLDLKPRLRLLYSALMLGLNTEHLYQKAQELIKGQQ